MNTTTFVSPEFDVVVDQLGTYTIYLRERADTVRARVLGAAAAGTSAPGSAGSGSAGGGVA